MTRKMIMVVSNNRAVGRVKNFKDEAEYEAYCSDLSDKAILNNVDLIVIGKTVSNQTIQMV